MDNQLYINNPYNFVNTLIKEEDKNIINSSNITVGNIKPDEDILDVIIYDFNYNKVETFYNYKDYKVFNQNREGFSSIELDPTNDLKKAGYKVGEYNIVYFFYRNVLGSESNLYFIKEISPDRTEIRISKAEINISEVNNFINESNTSNKLYYGHLYNDDSLFIILNQSTDQKGDVYLKLYEEIQPDVFIKNQLWLIEKKAEPISFNIVLNENEVSDINEPIDYSLYLDGPNFNIDVKDKISNNTEYTSYSEIFNTTSSLNLVKNKIKNGEVNIDFTDYNNFIYFSSTYQRLRVFYEKMSLLEQYNNSINDVLFNISGSTTGSYYYSSSLDILKTKSNEIIENFDPYENFLYFESGSKTWPKINSNYPYINQSTGSSYVQEWLGSSNELSPYYGGMLLNAFLFDENNLSSIRYFIPKYIRENDKYTNFMMFVDMIGHFYDNILINSQKLINKYDASNNLNKGISKEIVADVLESYGINIYSNNFSKEDIYSSLIGNVIPSGSYLYGELIDNFVTSSNQYPLSDINKEIYKRIYHNLPLLIKQKGSKGVINDILNIYGIPESIMSLNQYGNTNSGSYNKITYEYEKYHYTLEEDIVSFYASYSLNPNWNAEYNAPKSILFKFNPYGIGSNENAATTIFNLLNGTNDISSLESLGFMGFKKSGSYSGSLYFNFSNNSNTLYPIHNLPVSEDIWYNISMNISGSVFESSSSEIYIKGMKYGNLKLYEPNNIVFSTKSIFFPTENQFLYGGNKSLLFSQAGRNNIIKEGISFGDLFRGPVQEVRYYNINIDEESFDKFCFNSEDLSFKDNMTFRASLGSNLYINSSSIHPSLTYPNPTHSFNNNSLFYLHNHDFKTINKYTYKKIPNSGLKSFSNKNFDIVKNNESSSSVVDNTLRWDKKLNNIFKEKEILYSELGFSPQNLINEDIYNTYSNTNFLELISDPRFLTSSKIYEPLEILKNDYFKKYTSNPNYASFFRLVKYFDNSIFKFIKDFIPIENKISTGIILKQHILERNGIKTPQITYSDNLNTSSFDRIYEVKGGNGGLFNFNITSSNFTQSWIRTDYTPLGNIEYTNNDEKEFFNGEFGGSKISLYDGTLDNNDSDVIIDYLYKNTNYTGSITNVNIFLDPNTSPNQGEIYLWYDDTGTSIGNDLMPSNPGYDDYFPGGGGGGDSIPEGLG